MAAFAGALCAAVGNGTAYAQTPPASGCSVPSFAPPSTNAAGFRPYSIAVADLNGDGKLDLVIVNIGSDDVSVLLGNGDGSFQPAVNYGVGLDPVAVVIGDFNGDTKLDLAVSGDGVWVLLGKGDGTFQIPVKANKVTGSLVAGDFNSDGKLDLAVTDHGSTNSVLSATNVSVLLNKGDATFQAADNYSVGWGPYSMAIGDYNADGAPDLVVTSIGSNNVSVLLGKGDGTFQPAVSYGVGSSPLSVAVGDFNGDGKADLAVANSGSDDVSVLLGNGDGTFADAVSYRAGTRPQSVIVGDFNGDSKPDLAIADFNSDNISELLGNGDGTFQTSVFNISAGRHPASLAVGDFNGDGKPDLAVADWGDPWFNITAGDVVILLNTCASAGLRVCATRTNATVILSWPLPYTNFVLESTACLGSTNWRGVSEPVTTSGGRCETCVPVSVGDRQQYFRLRRP